MIFALSSHVKISCLCRVDLSATVDTIDHTVSVIRHLSDYIRMCRLSVVDCGRSVPYCDKTSEARESCGI